MKSNLHFSILLALLSAKLCSAQTTFSFNTEEEFSGNFFEPLGINPSVQYSWSATPGAGGLPGRVNSNDDEFVNTLFLNSPFFAPSSIPSQSSVVFYLSASVSHSIPLAVVELGYSDNPSAELALSARASVTLIKAGLVYRNPSEAALRVGIRSDSNALTSESSLSPVFPVTTGVYELTTSWQIVSGGVWQSTVNLLSGGVDGMSPFTEVATYSASFTNQTLAASTVYFGVNAFFDAPWIDNITIVPEPSSIALVCFSSLILGAHLFRRAKVRTRV